MPDRAGPGSWKNPGEYAGAGGVDSPSDFADTAGQTVGRPQPPGLIGRGASAKPVQGPHRAGGDKPPPDQEQAPPATLAELLHGGAARHIAAHLLNPSLAWHQLGDEDRAAAHEHLGTLSTQEAWRLLSHLAQQAPQYHHTPASGARDLLAEHLGQRQGREVSLDESNAALARVIDTSHLDPAQQARAAALGSLPRVANLPHAHYLPADLDPGAALHLPLSPRELHPTEQRIAMMPRLVESGSLRSPEQETEDAGRGTVGPAGTRAERPVAAAGGPVAAAAGGAGPAAPGERGQGADRPTGSQTTKGVPRAAGEVNRRLDHLRSLFARKARQAQTTQEKDDHEGTLWWLDALREHVNRVGPAAALAALGEPYGQPGATPAPVQYAGAFEDIGKASEQYLNYHGIKLLHQTGYQVDPHVPVVSSETPAQAGRSMEPRDPYVAGDFFPRDPTFPNKLVESQHLPGLESSEDLARIMGKPVTHLTREVIGALDRKYGAGRWIVKPYGDEAAMSHGIFFPQRVAQLREEHFGQDPALPDGGKDFMAQPAFPILGVSEAERARGKIFAPGEGRVHVITRNGKAEVVPYATKLKERPDLPVVFHDDHTRAMEQAAAAAVNQLPASERSGQIYAPDIIKTAHGYKVVELNPANSTGSSGWLGESPSTIDAYVSYLAGREPAHVRFIRNLLRGPGTWSGTHLEPEEQGQERPQQYAAAPLTPAAPKPVSGAPEVNQAVGRALAVASPQHQPLLKQVAGQQGHLRGWLAYRDLRAGDQPTSQSMAALHHYAQEQPQHSYLQDALKAGTSHQQLVQLMKRHQTARDRMKSFTLQDPELFHNAVSAGADDPFAGPIDPKEEFEHPVRTTSGMEYPTDWAHFEQHPIPPQKGESVYVKDPQGNIIHTATVSHLQHGTHPETGQPAWQAHLARQEFLAPSENPAHHPEPLAAAYENSFEGDWKPGVSPPADPEHDRLARLGYYDRMHFLPFGHSAPGMPATFADPADAETPEAVRDRYWQGTPAAQGLTHYTRNWLDRHHLEPMRGDWGRPGVWERTLNHLIGQRWRQHLEQQRQQPGVNPSGDSPEETAPREESGHRFDLYRLAGQVMNELFPAGRHHLDRDRQAGLERLLELTGDPYQVHDDLGGFEGHVDPEDNDFQNRHREEAARLRGLAARVPDYAGAPEELHRLAETAQGGRRATERAAHDLLHSPWRAENEPPEVQEQLATLGRQPSRGNYYALMNGLEAAWLARPENQNSYALDPHLADEGGMVAQVRPARSFEPVWHWLRQHVLEPHLPGVAQPPPLPPAAAARAPQQPWMATSTGETPEEAPPQPPPLRTITGALAGGPAVGTFTRADGTPVAPQPVDLQHLLHVVAAEMAGRQARPLVGPIQETNQDLPTHAQRLRSAAGGLKMPERLPAPVAELAAVARHDPENLHQEIAGRLGTREGLPAPRHFTDEPPEHEPGSLEATAYDPRNRKSAAWRQRHAAGVETYQPTPWHPDSARAWLQANAPALLEHAPPAGALAALAREIAQRQHFEGRA